MTVLLEQEYKNEIDTKVFKVLVAFSQSIERSLINNQNTLHQAENSLNININTQPQAIDSSQFDSSNLGLYTVQLVRNVIKRSNDLSDEFNSLVNTITQQQQQKEKQYKDEIQFLKSRIEQLSNTNSNNNNNNNTNKNIYSENNNNNIIKIDKLENISLDENSKENNNNNNNNENNNNNNEDKLNVQKQSSPVGSSLSVSSKEANLDWDTKYQTELQLNAMLSEFLKDDFEISNLNLGVSDEVSSTTSPSISTTSTANTGLGSSGSFSPNSNTTSPSLNLSNSSTNSLSTTANNSSNNNNNNGGGSDKTQQNVQKKAMLTDLLDQIDLDSGSNTPSKQKKGKFKFF
ncbi:hypothetical protein ACTFIU_005353 [Dictyostelium citrinum]